MSRCPAIAVLGVVLALLAAGCGSTVAPRDAGGAEPAAGMTVDAATEGDGLVGVAGPGTGGAAASGPSSRPGVAAPTASPGAPGAAGASATTGAAVGTEPAQPGTAPGPAAPAGPAPVAPAGTDAPIQVGIQILVNGAATLGALGLDVQYGDSRAQAEAIVADINSRGGLAGRPIEPVYYEQDGTDGQTPDQRMQEACSTWTEDAQVEAAVSIAAVTDPLVGCLADHGIPFMLNTERYDRVSLEEFAPYLYLPNTISIDRWAATEVDRLVAQAFFDPGARIGLLRGDNPSSDRTKERVIVPALARHGLTLSRDVAFKEGGDPQVASQLSNAILAFRSEGITHVLSILNGGGIVLFMTAAEQQGYRPRYGLSTLDAPGALLESSAPDAQLVGSRGVGWRPSWDVNAANDPGLTSGGQRCAELMERAGQDIDSSRIARHEALGHCDVLFVLEQAAAVGGATDSAAIQAGMAALGSSFIPADTFSTFLEPGRYDGAATVRDFVYDEGCGCFVYVSDEMPVAP